MNNLPVPAGKPQQHTRVALGTKDGICAFMHTTFTADERVIRIRIAEQDMDSAAMRAAAQLLLGLANKLDCVEAVIVATPPKHEPANGFGPWPIPPVT